MAYATDAETAERELLRRAARAFFAERAPLERLAEAETGADDPERRRAIAELGWLEAGRPGSLAALAAVLVEEAGRALLPDPFVATLAVVHSLARAGDPLGLLPDVVAGRRVVVPALCAAGGDIEVDGAGRVSGTIAFVEGATAADSVLVGPVPGGWRLVDTRPPGMRLRPMTAIVGRLWTEIECAGVPSQPAGDLTLLVEVGAALQSAYAAGAAAALLESTVAYVSERRQFGRAIGSFQAVQHTLASAAIATDQARVLARRALSEVDRAGDPARYWSSVAFVGATDRFVDVARRCHQVWGGMGFSTESHVHHFSRRARFLTQTWGGRDRHLDVVARERLRMPLLRDRYAQARA